MHAVKQTRMFLLSEPFTKLDSCNALVCNLPNYLSALPSSVNLINKSNPF